MKTAVIKTGGKQYVVHEGDVLKVEKLRVAEGESVVFDEVLLVTTGANVEVGTPLVKGAKVEARVMGHRRHKKVFGVKVKPKKRYKKYFGHKQPYTEVEIKKIAQ